jgi:thiamine-phosphate diphosphorylase
MLESIDLAVRAGIDAVQLREKDLPDRDLYELALDIQQTLDGRCPLIINSRLDVALAIGAQGVHLPENGLPLAASRSVAQPGFLFGRSVHSPEGAINAQTEGGGYVQLGTIFETESKPGLRPSGLELVRQATEALTIPCLAVGGIDDSNAGSVIAAGASGVAVVSYLLRAEDVGDAVRRLRRAMTSPARVKASEDVAR